MDQASIRGKTLEGQLEELLKEVYVHHGEFYSLISDVDSSRPRETLAENLEHITTLLMDRRYPQHPNFLAEPKKQDLDALLAWMVQAGETNLSVAYDEGASRVLRNLGQPLELVNLGQTKASLRLDTRYIKDVLQRSDHDSVVWAPIAEHLRDTYGLQPLVADLFLCFLCQRDHRALQNLLGEPVDVRIGMSPTIDIRLQRGKLVSAADWHRLRDLGNQLFNVARPSANRSLRGQDRFTTLLREHGQEKRTVLQGLHQWLVRLGIEEGGRLKEIATANARLAPLAEATTDSFKVLTELLAFWSDDASDPLRAVVQQAVAVRDALGELNEHARTHLNAGVNHPAVGAEVRDHLGALTQRLTAAQAEQPVTLDWVKTWNRKAQQLIQQLIEQPTPPTPEPPSRPGEPVVPRPPVSAVLLEIQFDPGDPDAVTSFLAQVRNVLTAQAGHTISVVLVRREDVR